MKKFIYAATIAAMPTFATAASIDLTDWTENGLTGLGAGTWTVQTGNDSVVQSSNGQPTVFFDPTLNSQGTTLGGEITVNTGSDNDFVGFVLGYNSDEFDSTSADFWLVDWKQADQDFYGTGGTAGADGLALSHVTGDLTAAPESDFWNHVNTVNEVARGTNLGSTGWNDNQTYVFELIFTDTLIQISVDGEVEISYAGNFTDGSFGFYNYSQSNVEYAGITADIFVDPNTVPLPAGLPLLLAGLGAFGFMRRRQSNA